MKTSKGVIQGYNGVTMVDDKKQIIVAAEAYGNSHEQAALEPMIDQTRENLATANNKEDVFSDGKLTADSGFHSEANMKMLSDNEIDAYVADPKMRNRDPRFDHSGCYKVRDQKERKRRTPRRKKFTPDDFSFAADLKFCTGPAGKKLYRSGYRLKVGSHEANKFKASKSACTTWDLRSKCLRYPERTAIRQVAHFHGRSLNAPGIPISHLAESLSCLFRDAHHLDS